tara:strand:- start:368 stop:2671 length:2304 start_codon:yes stop_codon:yes gene_type:complete
MTYRPFPKKRLHAFTMSTLLFFTSLCVPLCAEDQAFLKPNLQTSSLESQTKEQRTLLFADKLSYDHKNSRVKAKGNVEVSRGDIILYADEIIYDQKQDQIVATGHVRLVDAQKNITFTDRFEISGDLKQGLSETVQGIMADDSLYAANKINRKGGTYNQLDQVVYSPCKVCRKDPSTSPTWLIKSRHMVWDEETGDITHADSTLEMWGVPVMYTPYLSHPGPTVKRRSGVLTPFFGGSANLGAIIGVPYYWAIDESKDLTITPVYTRENPLLILAYRQAFCQGFWDFETSITKSRYTRGPEGDETSENQLRGHIKTKAHFNVTDNWHMGFDLQRSLDDTYLKKYRFLGLGQESFLTSRIYTDTFWGRNYALLEGINYQSLQQEDSTSHIPFVAPSAEIHLLSQPYFLDGTFSLDASVLNLQRRKGQNMKRFSSELGWKAQWISTIGTVTDFGLQGRGDIYRVTNLPLNNQSRYSGQRARFIPKAHAHVKYPFYRPLKGGRFIIEPIAGVVLTANGRNAVRIPNEDSLLFELSDANILSPNRLTGLDVVDEWTRLNYGAKFAYYSKDVGNSELFFGQSHSLTKVPKDLDETGLRSKRSDYVARAHYVYKDWVEISNHLLLSKKSLRAKRNESSMTIGQPILKLNATYTRFPKLSIPGISIEQVSYGASSQFTKQWSVAGNITRELGHKGGNLSHGGTLSYEDDCFKFTSSIVKTFYVDRDYKPGVTVMFRLSFKNLGDVQISGDQLGLGQKAQARKGEEDEKERNNAI